MRIDMSWGGSVNSDSGLPRQRSLSSRRGRGNNRDLSCSDLSGELFLHLLHLLLHLLLHMLLLLL
jgi:hypothetical protein